MSTNDTATQTPESRNPKSIWDNDLPAGDAPPLPRWPLTVSVVVYGLWMVFLVAMMILRLRYPG